MNKWLWIILVFIILQRVIELMIAKRNEIWLKERGGIEKGAEHYKWFVIVHTLFFISIIIEIILQSNPILHLNYFLFIMFIIIQIGRFWCMYSLGKFWNTKVIILPGAPIIQKGPYKYIKHPNYIIVGFELFIVPLIFEAYITAIIFPILHLLLLRKRIPLENKALLELIHE